MNKAASHWSGVDGSHRLTFIIRVVKSITRVLEQKSFDSTAPYTWPHHPWSLGTGGFWSTDQAPNTSHNSATRGSCLHIERAWFNFSFILRRLDCYEKTLFECILVLCKLSKITNFKVFKIYKNDNYLYWRFHGPYLLCWFARNVTQSPCTLLVNAVNVTAQRVVLFFQLFGRCSCRVEIDPLLIKFIYQNSNIFSKIKLK